MRFGVSAQDQQYIAEEMRQSRKVVSLEAQEMMSTPPESVDNLNNTEDPALGGQMVFVFGLHNPFNTARPTWFPGT
jgi:hypothetical protein